MALRHAHSLTSEQQHDRMLHMPIPRLVSTLCVPTVTSQLVSVIYNTADTWFVSQISTSASAAVGAAFSLMSFIQAAGCGLGMGCSSLVSIRLGEKKDQEAECFANSGAFAALLAGLLVCVGGLCFLEPLMRLLGSTPTMLPHACAYARFILINAPIMCLSFVLNNVLRAEGEATVAMWGLCIGGLLNIALDPLFIFRLGMGTAGAALATALSQTVSFVILLLAFLRGRSILKLRLSAVSRDLKTYGKIIAVGIPTVFRQGLASLASATLNVQAAVYDDAAVAAVTIANKVYLLIRNIILGIGQGFQPVAGYNFGAGDRQRTRQAFWFSTLLGTGVCLVSSALILSFAGPIVGWFRNDPEVIRIGKLALLYGGAVMPLMAYSTFVNQMYQCLGFKLPATVLASCRQGICFLPLIWGLPILLGLQGVQMAQPMADLLTFVISVPFQIWFFRHRLALTDSAQV